MNASQEVQRSVQPARGQASDEGTGGFRVRYGDEGADYQAYSERGLYSRTHSDILRANEEVQQGRFEVRMGQSIRESHQVFTRRGPAGNPDGRDQVKGLGCIPGYSHGKGLTIRGSAHTDHQPTSTSED